MGFWNFARSYDRALADFPPYLNLQSLVAEYTQCIPHIKILDLGCGTGNTTQTILEKYRSTRGILVDGVDSSQDMLSIASEKFMVPIYENLEMAETTRINSKKSKLFHTDALSFLLRAKEKEIIYDRIVAVNSLYTLKDQKQVLETIYQILDDGGIFVVANPFLPKIAPIFSEYFSQSKFSRAFQLFKKLPYWFIILKKNISIARSAFSHFSFSKPDDLRKLLSDVGFLITNETVAYGGTVAIFSCRKDRGNIRRAHTQEEIEETFKIRGEVYSTDLPSFKKEDLKNGMEYDIFDERGIHFISRVGKKIVGCIRLIPDSEIGFLMESHFKLPEWINRVYVLEASRDALIGEFRGRGLARGIEERAYEWSKRNGYKIWCFMINRDLIPKLAPIWMPVQLGEEMLYHNTYSTPMIRIL